MTDPRLSSRGLGPPRLLSQSYLGGPHRVLCRMDGLARAGGERLNYQTRDRRITSCPVCGLGPPEPLKVHLAARTGAGADVKKPQGVQGALGLSMRRPPGMVVLAQFNAG